MPTDPVLRTRMSIHVAHVRARLRPPVVLLAVLAVLAVFLRPGGLTALAVENLDAAGQGVPTISIADQAVVEGNSGSISLTFAVTLSSASQQEVRVNYGTFAATATGGVLSTTFTSPGPIVIPDVGVASDYPALINVSGIAALTEEILVSINGLTHTSPGDLDVLLEGPAGRRMIVQSDVGGGGDVSNVTYSLHDAGPAMSTTLLVPGTARPTSVDPPDVFPSPAPPGPHPEAGPAGAATLESVFRGIDPNGFWKLYVADDSPTESGSIDNWALTVGVPDPTKDYATRFGQAVFPPGSTTQEIVVTVNGDTNVEPHETFRVVLFAPVNGGLGDDQADGTILNDDGGVTPPTAVDDTYQSGTGAILDVPASQGVLTNDNSNGGGPMTAVLVNNAKYGLLTLRPDGGFYYIPNDPQILSDEFTYRAVNGSGASVVATVRLTLTPGVSSPANLRVDSVVQNSVGQSTVTVRFDRPSLGLAPTGFALAGGVLPGQTLVVAPTGSTYPIASFLAPTGSFYLRAYTLAGTLQSGPSNEVPLHTNITVPPSAPANLLGLVDGTSVALAWQNTFGGGIPTNVILNVSGAGSASVPLGATETFSFPSVPPGSYTVSVTAANAGGVSPPSNPVTLTFPGPCTGPPETPADFLAYPTLAAGTYRVSATWYPPPAGPAPTGYQLHVSSAVFTGSLPVAQRSISGPVPPGTYTLSVSATNACGTSAPTGAQVVVVS